MRHHAGRVIRTIATALTLAAERIDPQPPAKPFRFPDHFTITGADGQPITCTTFYKAPVKWHRTG